MDKFKGSLMGLAVGDALGTTLEFCDPGTFPPITDIVGGGWWKLQPGQWTDDTSMALCLASSLLEKDGFDPIDQLQKYCKWYKTGYMSSTGTCFDIGNATQNALEKFGLFGTADCGSTNPRSAGNGSIMRLAPIPMFFKDKTAVIEFSKKSSLTTHGAKTCVDACAYLGYLIWKALNGFSKDDILTHDDISLCPEIENISRGSFKTKFPPNIKGTGYVVDSLEAALWAFHMSTDFESGCLLAVNLGDDADTTGAVYGQIAGAYYGYSNIPESWVKKIAHRELIEELAVKLYNSTQI